MKKVRVLVTIAEFEGKRKYLNRIAAVSRKVEVVYRSSHDPETSRRALQAVPDVEVLFVNRPPRVLENADSLRWVEIHHAGVEREVSGPIFDPDRRIIVTNTAGAHAVPVAEYALTAMVVLLRDFIRLVNDRATRTYERDHSPPVELWGRTVGIAGYGQIGREIARLAQAHNMRVLAMKGNPREKRCRGYPWPGVGDRDGRIPERYFGPTGLMKMLPRCDFVVDCLPHTPMTDRIFGADQFRAMKPTAYFINVGRGGTMDVKALAQALKEGAIAGAAIDDFGGHSVPPPDFIWDAPNTFISPHISGNRKSVLYIERTLELFCENLRRYLARRPMYNIVSREKGY